MADGRARLSGCEYRKKAEEKKQRERQLLAKTAKIDKFFSKGLSESPIETEAETAPPVELRNVPPDSGTSVDDFFPRDDRMNNVDRSSSTDPSSSSFTSSEFDSDPAKWIVNDELRDYVARNGHPQNSGSDFSNSKRIYQDQARFFSSNFLQRKLPNGEISNRQWLIYSESTGMVFCGPCLLFSNSSSISLVGGGFNDWKNARTHFETHEQSRVHKESAITLKTRSLGQNLSLMLESERAQEVRYWKEVMKRVAAVVRKLTSRGLPLRGSNEVLRSSHNGNFLMVLELLAEFDPFMKEHLTKHGAQGSGKTSYLSSTTFEDVVRIVARKCREVIANKLKTAKYFSLIVDSTPDISHVDQLSIVLRFVQENGSPSESFLNFVPNTGHTGQELYDAITEHLLSAGIDLKNCRGQSYDNAANMSGSYKGLQARIKAVNEFAEFVPCSAHSLNLVGTAAASCCPESTRYFMFLQGIYNFFSATPTRWEKLKHETKLTLKSLSSTRWSCRYEACKALLKSWKPIYDTLESISTDTSEKALVRAEAGGFMKQMSKFETAFMTIFWGRALDRINAVSKKLQREDADVELVMTLYESLISYFTSLRGEFAANFKDARALFGDESLESRAARTRKRKRHFDDSDEDEGPPVCTEDALRDEVFFPVVDCL
ncbi:zinc finger MYM-type protein 1-like, partial [Galendromus occidentalis]|uniref:Zinc finger MYM-type protein 1-like n=1 Tax=Galendromus occidentalis TaxID=34638 RepID=A0AAJ6QNG5_9ACAR